MSLEFIFESAARTHVSQTKTLGVRAHSLTGAESRKMRCKRRTAPADHLFGFKKLKSTRLMRTHASFRGPADTDGESTTLPVWPPLAALPASTPGIFVGPEATFPKPTFAGRSSWQVHKGPRATVSRRAGRQKHTKCESLDLMPEL